MERRKANLVRRAPARVATAIVNGRAQSVAPRTMAYGGGALGLSVLVAALAGLNPVGAALLIGCSVGGAAYLGQREDREGSR